MPIRIALMGAGAMGSLVAREVYPRLTDLVEIVAVVDRDPDRAAAVATPLGAIGVSSLTEAASAGLDAVDVRLPHAAHREGVLAALDLGLHVLVEKPLASTVADAAEIVRAATASDRLVAVTENYPHLLAVRAARRAIDAGRIGELLALRTTRAYVLDGIWLAPWRRAGAQSGVLWDQGTHHVSLLRTLAGDVTSASAARATRSGDGVESVVLDLTFASGVVAQSLFVWGTPAVAVESEAVAMGTAGRLQIDVDYVDSGGGASLVLPNSAPVRLSDPECYYDSHRWIVEDWVDAIRAGRQPLVDVDSALHDVLVVEAARRSIERGGAAVSLAEIAP